MKKKQHQITVILDNIRSALNVGAIFRTCDAANIQKLYLCGITAYPPHNKIPKTALGAVETVPWKYFKNTSDAVKAIKLSDHTAIVSVELTKSAKNFWDFKFKTPLALVLGNEITGVSKEVLEASDAVVKIPMYGQKESLNVATSCGVVVYEVLRQIRTT
ncbi:RNA methyltransferase [Candidatus Dojkabacteria bacterium]|nr:RNA methyltransferase [Candidatus Dojkabacteria bacterium]